jgi:hypothetical protein
VKQLSLKILIVSVILSAAFGVYALVVGDFGETEVRILLSSLTVSATSILSMACGVAWERRRVGFVPPAGALLAILTGAATLVGIWGEIEDFDNYWKPVISVGIASIACAHVSLMGLARLEARFRWAQPTAYLLALLLAAGLIVMICTEEQDETAWRWIGVLSVLLSAMTIVVPVLHRMSAQEKTTLFCPGCGAPLPQPGEPCTKCGARYSIERLD